MQKTKQFLAGSAESADSKKKDSFKIRRDKMAGLQVRYAEAGETKENNVVMIHGGGVSLGFMALSKMIHALGSEYHVYAPDMPGYGSTEKTSQKATLEYNAGFIERFMTRRQIKQANFVAESFGGGIALEYALNHKDSVKSLVLIDSYGFVEKHFSTLAYVLTRINAGLQKKIIKNLAKSEHLFGMGLKLVLGGCEGIALTKEKIKAVQNFVTQHNLTTACLEFVQSEVTTHGLRTNFKGRIHELNSMGVPILFVHGTNDPLFPIKNQQKVAEKIKNARFVRIDTAHQPEITHPEIVIRETMQLLRRAN